MSTFSTSDLLYKLTMEAPKNPDTKSPLLIANPKFYDSVLQTPGVAIVTGYFGYGKTYGYGLNTYHRIRGVEVCGEISLSKKAAAIYANLSYVKNVVPGGDTVEEQLVTALRRPLVDIELYHELRKGAQFYATFDVSKLGLAEEEPSSFAEFLLELYQALSEKYSTLYLILDEFEQLSIQPSPSDVAQIVNIVVKSYRSGKSVGDVAPGFLKLILLVQKAIYSEEEIKSALGDSAAVGRVLKVGNNFGIPVEYSLHSLLTYLKCAVLVAERLGSVDKNNAQALIDLFEGPERELARYLEAMAELPGLVVFPTLINALGEALIMRDPITAFTKRILEGVKRYGVDALAKTTIRTINEEVNVDMTRALRELVKVYFGDMYPAVSSKWRGYSAIVVKRDGEADVLIYRHTEVNETTFKKFVEEKIKKMVGDKKKINWFVLYAKPIKEEKIVATLKEGVKLRRLRPKEFYALYFTASELITVEGLTRTVKEVMRDLAADLWKRR